MAAAARNGRARDLVLSLPLIRTSLPVGLARWLLSLFARRWLSSSASDDLKGTLLTASEAATITPEGAVNCFLHLAASHEISVSHRKAEFKPQEWAISRWAAAAPLQSDDADD